MIAVFPGVAVLAGWQQEICVAGLERVLLLASMGLWLGRDGRA